MALKCAHKPRWKQVQILYRPAAVSLIYSPIATKPLPMRRREGVNGRDKSEDMPLSPVHITLAE